MALCQINFTSQALGKMTVMDVIVPEGIKGPFPVFYLLHGFSHDYSGWTRFTNLERYAQDYPFLIVIPDCGRGFFVDSKGNPNMAYEAQIVPDLIDFIDSTFQTNPKRESRVIGGLSMGGYGAIKYALKFPNFFCAAASHSGAPGYAHTSYEGDDPFGTEMRLIFGTHPTGGVDDVYALAEKAKGGALPALLIDCGTEDEGVIDRNRKYHAFLERIGIPHTYAEHPGDHNWQYWDEHVQDALAFFAKVMGIEKRQPE